MARPFFAGGIGILLFFAPLPGLSFSVYGGENLPPSVVGGKDQSGFPASAVPATPFPPPSRVEFAEECGRGIQRTMKRLAESSPDRRNTVRILFYGQSITEQDWSRQVSEDLRRRFPFANLVIENRAIGGFASNLLVQAAEADLYPFYPDLVIFYDYGRQDKYEEIIRNIRLRSTSEILLQTDHVNGDQNVEEETDPNRVTMAQWSSWFPNVFIPGLAKRYQTGMVQQRALWKLYLRENHLEPKALTRDGVHLNEQGNFLMAALMQAYLVRRSSYDEGNAEKQIRDYPVGPDMSWKEGRLLLPFSGNKVDVIAQPGATGRARVLIDGRKPSEFSELYTSTRVSGFPQIGWPVISKVTHESMPVEENWTATVTEISPDGTRFKFEVEGSVTGKDGEGKGGTRFVSNSGRVVIEAEAWNMGDSFSLLRRRSQPLPEKVLATWKTVPLFVDEYRAPEIPDAKVETLVTLAQGLSNGPHRLELISDEPVPLRAIRVHEPPLK